ncbi:MAG: S41 family peptidase [Pseudomonadota bacterium]
MKWLVLAVLCGLLQACGGSSGPQAPIESADACSIGQQRETLRAFMQDKYYWYAQLQEPDESATSMEAYFHSMLAPQDRFSFSESTAAHTALFTEGRRTGYGYTLMWADAAQTSFRVRNVEPASPVARAGLTRGDTILAIDGYAPVEIAQGALPVVTTPGVTRHFVVANIAGERREFDVVSEDFPLTPVANTATFDITRDGAPVKVGYINYSQFVGYSVPYLNLAFINFRQAGIGELILDLRYNGGGSVGTSRDLASMIGGARTAGQLYSYLRFSDRQSASTQQFRFNTAQTSFALPLPNGLPRVVVIASGDTASASELLVNGLRPFVDVVLVGETTYGKPYGFIPRDICGTTYNAVQFESLNSLGQGGFTSGFTPDCAVPDDFTHALGDANEGRTRVALNYLATGSCGAAPQGRLAAPKAAPPRGTFGETPPPGMFPQ